MKPKLRLAAVAVVALFAAACVRLNTPEKKAGYAVGESIGKSLAKIKDKVDMGQVTQGLADEAAGKPALKDDQMGALLAQLGQGKSTDPAKTGYAVGMSIGRNVKDVLQFADLGMIERGMKDELAGSPKLSDADAAAALQNLSQRRQQVVGAQNLAQGQAYLAKNRALPGVKVTASGLQYQILRQGSGRRPKATDTVTVNYVGTLVDGTKFDSSYDRRQPATFQLNRVIPGWTEGLQLMRAGGKARFVIPANLGYGAAGAGPQIGPNAVLVFEVELISVKK